MTTTREEHLNWCKQRALEYVEKGEIADAFMSMVSDLGKHEETKGHIAIQLGGMLLATNNLSTAYQMKNFIEGFN